MTEAIIAGIVAPLIAWALDRAKYNRTIVKGTQALAPALPNATARKVAEQAVIAANQREIERAVAKLEKAEREHKVRMAAIQSGSANFGDLHKDGR